MKYENSEELMKAVKSKVKDVMATENDNVFSTLQKYEKELEEQGKASKETTNSLAKMAENFAEMQEKQEEAAESILDIAQQLADGYDGQGKIKGAGDIITEHERFKDFQAGHSKKLAIMVKNTILTESGSPATPDGHLVDHDRVRGIVPLAFRSLNVLDVIPQGTTTSDVIKFGKENTITNAAAETAQGASKPESTITYTSDTENVETIPTFLKVSKQALRDAPFLASSINARLGHMVRHRLQQQIIAGNGTAPNLSGLTTTGNHTDYTAVSGDSELDTINQMKYAVMGADYESNLVIMNPADWGVIERKKVASGNNSYAYGDGNGITYVNNGLTALAWGLPVVLTNDLTADNALVLDRFACQVFLREDLRVEMFEQDEDNVQKNLVTVRAELDAAFAVYANGPIRHCTDLAL
jgi:HK97 family phage major capsid protein